MLDRLLMPLARPSPEKAASGIGMTWMTNEPHISLFNRDPREGMKQAQGVAIRNRWIRASERAISQAFGTVPWHLETPDGEHVTDESPPELRAIRDLIEKPYQPQDGDPQTATPKTRSGLWGLSSRHTGVCGVSAWYLDQTEALAGTPLAILYVNPARLTPSESNGQLVGWVLDADAYGGGTPLNIEQIILFTLEEPDFGWFPPGLVETAMASVNVTTFADRHAAGSLASGGKLAGVYSPRGENSLPPDVFQTLEKELRQASEDPDSVRRSVILKGPIDFTPTSATPQQLDLVAVQGMARDDVLALWGVPYSQLGGSAPSGLNSGGKGGYEEAVFWQKAVAPRMHRFVETVQFQLLDRYAKRGLPVELVIEEPTFDDDAPMYAIAKDALNLPLRNVERRALVGLPPLGDEVLDNAVVMPLNMVEYAAAPPEGAAKASTPAARGVKNVLPKLEKALADFLDEQRRAIVAKVRANAGHIAKKPSDTGAWWSDEWDGKLKKVLAPYASEIANMTAERTTAKLGAGKAAEFADLTGNAVLQRLLARLGTRIKGINETTREAISAAIKEGIEAGDGAAQLGDRVEEAAAFDEYRAELIARTESARVLNESQIESFREYGVAQVRAIDGDEDEECAARDGQEFDLDDALEIVDHPNGTLDWVPIVGEGEGKAGIMPRQEPPAPQPTATFGIPQITMPLTVTTTPPDMTPIAAAMSEQAVAMKALADRPNPANIINVEPPPATVVNVPAPIVNITAPDPAEKAATPQDVRVVSMPTRTSTARKRVTRDRNGLITEVLEEEVEQ